MKPNMIDFLLNQDSKQALQTMEHLKESARLKKEEAQAVKGKQKQQQPAPMLVDDKTVKLPSHEY